jgi:putative cell wall-binding protein
VLRIMGTDRYDTARRTAEFVGPGAVGTADPTGGGALRTAVVANGLGFADALAAGPLSYAGAAAAAAGNQNGFPTLLTGAAALAPEAEAALRSLGIQQVILPGGTAAVGPAVESRLRGLGITVIRLAGADRTATAAAVARFAVGDSPGYPVGLAFDRSAVTLARGDGFADALAGAAYAGDRAIPLLLTTTPDALGAATVGYLQSVAGVTSSVTAFGGSGAVTANALSAALSALSAERV